MTGRPPLDPPLRPSPIELAAGRMYGVDGQPDELGTPPAGLTLRASLEQVMLPALERPPCLVSFSGGRDSSGVLAAATHAARREGLDPPVPITLRFRDAPLTEESSWQERVVRHLGLSDWEVREPGRDLDFVGSASADVLRRRGVLYAPNAFFHRPMLEAASGGALLTGVGGDEIFLEGRWQRVRDLLARRKPPVPRDVLRLGYAASPVVLRRRVELRRAPRKPCAWLRPQALRLAHALAARESAGEPVWWSQWVGWMIRRRFAVASRRSLSLLAMDAGVLLVHPLVHPRFLSTLARAGGRLGFGGRTDIMRALFADALPPALLARESKARFDEVFWGRESREFAASWDGSGVDRDLVDPAALRDEWLKPSPDFRSAMLLQSAWLSRYHAGIMSSAAR